MGDKLEKKIENEISDDLEFGNDLENHTQNAPEEAVHVEAADEKHTQNLQAFAKRKMNLTLIFFIILIAAVAYTSYQAVNNVTTLTSLYAQHTQLERFKASLPNILLPLNDFILIKNNSDIKKIDAAIQTYRQLYKEVSRFENLTTDDAKALKEVSQMMVEVTSLASDITKGKIPYEQAGSLAVVAHNLVFVGGEKIHNVAEHLSDTLSEQTDVAIKQMTVLSIINLVMIVAVLFLLFGLNRVFTRNITSHISGAAENIADSSEEILLAVDRQATASTTQAGTVVGVTQELKEMSASAVKIAATANSVEKIAVATSLAATEGAKAVQEAIGHMELIREEVTRIAEKVTDAGRKAEQILESIDSIQEIADETHLLALNASIESSAAGEYGKRFSVVASEVRRLSERAKEFTEEIQVVVNEVHSSTKESIAVTQKGLEEVAKGVQIARRAGDALAKMQDMSSKTSQAVHTIAMATNRQSDSSQDFADTMQQITLVLQDSAEQLHASRESATKLNEVSDELRKFL